MKNLAIIILVVLFLTSCTTQKKEIVERPNILWIAVEDMSCHFGYNGEKLVKTPHVDRLASEGIVYQNAYVTAPVCSASRSAMITGMYQTSIGAHHHRSSRGTEKIYLPDGMITVPEMFKAAGYYTSNCQIEFDRVGKTDYNFVYENDDLYDGTDWSDRAEGQPFFAQVQLRGGKLRQGQAPKMNPNAENTVKEAGLFVTEDQITLPPYYPDVPAFRKDWALYLNTVQYTDMEVGKIIERLKNENLLDNTVVIFITDHGISNARGKQFLYDEGAKIPFIVWAPKKFKPQVKDDLINHIDMAATSLELAGIEIPEYMDANPLLGKNYQPRDYIVTARDRCDETVDHIRSVRKGNFKYIKNYLPLRPYLQPCAYKDHKHMLIALRELDKKGKLNEIQQLVTAKVRPTEELYDLTTDPFEINNLANDKNYSEKLSELRNILKKWEVETGDKGVNPEPMAMFDSDMKVYVDNIKKKDAEHAMVIEKNIALMKKWAEEGK